MRMMANAFLSRHRRLLALGALSMALHGALLELAARRAPGPPGPPATPLPLSVRLVDARPQSAPQADAPAPALATREVSRPQPEPVPKPKSKPKPAARPDAAAGAAARTRAEPPAPAAGRRILVATPGTYQVRTAPSARLSYTLVRQGQPAAGQPAYLDWRTDGSGYTLELDGLLGRLSSRGTNGDAGLVPELATEARSERTVRTGFDAATGEIRFESGAGSVPGGVGMQDRASVLVQLAAIGKADAEQLQDEVAILVAGAGSAAIERYQVLGEEEVATGIGGMAAWHLAQSATPGQPRLELWLAPAQDWLPVQLRLTYPDGSVSTQVLRAAERPAAPR